MNNNNPNLGNDTVDHIVTTLKGSLGAIPYAGPILAELVGTTIPNQRLDRLVDYAHKLGSKLENVEEQLLTSKISKPEFADLLEESLQQSTRSLTDDRREQIANLVTHGITQDEIDEIQSKHFLRILGELNDIEIVLLISHSLLDRGLSATESEFLAKNGHLAYLVGTDSGSSQAELDQASVQNSYHIHLEGLGLLQGSVDTSFNITPIGHLLVRLIHTETVG